MPAERTVTGPVMVVGTESSRSSVLAKLQQAAFLIEGGLLLLFQARSALQNFRNRHLALQVLGKPAVGLTETAIESA